jgi:hypothetical protein
MVYPTTKSKNLEREKVKYVGLTDKPDVRKTQHGNPPDWWQKKFETEKEARAWEKEMLDKPGYTGGTGGEGWKYGYTYTITENTTQ